MFLEIWANSVHYTDKYLELAQFFQCGMELRENCGKEKQKIKKSDFTKHFCSLINRTHRASSLELELGPFWPA